MKAPRLDTRSRQDIVDAALALALQYTPQWGGVSDPVDPGRRLVALFARLAELLIERLNRVPEKNFLSFLELAGIERFPGAPAEAPVTFVVSRRVAQGGLVPAGTQVATTQTERSDALIFETRRPFFATSARLERIASVSPAADRFAILAVPAVPPDAAALAAVPTAVFDASEPTLQDADHILYLGSETLFGRSDTADVDVTLHLVSGTFPSTGVVWRRYDKAAAAWVGLGSTPAVDHSVPDTAKISFSSLASVGKTTIDGVEDFWLAAHFVGPFDSTFAAPVVSGVDGVVKMPAQAIQAFDAAFFNSDPIDLSKPYQPFGRRPSYGDAFYFASAVGFGADVEQATLTFSIRPYVHAALQAQFAGLPTSMSVRTVARWQYLNASGQWIDLAKFDHEFQFAATTGAVTQISQEAPPGSPHASEGTFIGTSGATLVSVALTGFQDQIGLRETHGVLNRWMRVLLVSDNPYGRDGVLTGSGTTTKFIGPLFMPPTIEAVWLSFVPRTTPVLVSNVKTLNGFAFRDHASPLAQFEPFRPVSSRRIASFEAFGTDPALYFAFDIKFGAVFVSVFFDLAGPVSSLTSPLETGNPAIAWEYWSESGWAALAAEDGTLDLTTSGAIAFVGPLDSAPAALFPQIREAGAPDPIERFWYRARLAGGTFDHPPRVRGIYLNTVFAENRPTVREDLIVGSSNGEPDQLFALVKRPVLGGDLWVRETDVPSENEVIELENEHRNDVAEESDVPSVPPVVQPRIPAGIAGAEPEIWVRWRRTPNFLASGARSRHFTLDAVAGIVRFGDGLRGLIPPVVRNNLVFRDFQTGGGEIANFEAAPLAVVELKTSVPFIDRVFNVQRASGGASPWSLSELQEFGPQALKNRGRSVTTEDYEWMVRQRFSHIARVRCLPTSAPAPGGGLQFKAGAVTVLVVPKSAERRPQPTQGLIRAIREFLARTSLRNIAADIYVKGPDYIAVRIAATVVPVRPELTSVVLRHAGTALEDFLHPLTGGEEGTGYGFGRAVYLSEVAAVLERIVGVDHVESVEFLDAPGADAFPVSGNSLASSGTHVVLV